MEIVNPFLFSYTRVRLHNDRNNKPDSYHTLQHIKGEAPLIVAPIFRYADTVLAKTNVNDQ